MNLLSHQQAGQLGEALALAKLNSLGLAAYSSPVGAPGHDLMVVIDDSAKSIEVKTRQFRSDTDTAVTRWPVNMQTKGDADYFLFVELQVSTMVPKFYLLCNTEARKLHKTYVSKNSGKVTGTISISSVRQNIEPNDFGKLSR